MVLPCRISPHPACGSAPIGAQPVCDGVTPPFWGWIIRVFHGVRHLYIRPRTGHSPPPTFMRDVRPMTYTANLRNPNGFRAQLSGDR